MRYLAILLLFILHVSCFKKSESTEVKAWKSQAEQVEIIRDDFGVPHIYGKTDADAVFGLLYAQCEDDFNRVEQNYLWATGRLAEVEGEKALHSDLRANLFMTEQEAKQQFEASPDWLKKLCVAFADGINYFLYTHPEVKPRLLTHFEPWMPLYFSEGSIGGDIESISTKKIQEFYDQKDSLTLALVYDGLIAPLDAEPRGSNGFAIAGSHTKSQYPMLLINPHTSFFFRGEVHVVSEEGLNAYGAVTWGQFFVYQGFNDKMGWMHTSSKVDVMDEFEETIVKKDKGLFYRYDQEERALQVQNVTLKYKDGPQMAERSFPIYRSHHGPITHKNENKWVATAMMWDPVKALTQSYLRTKMANYEAFDQLMDIRTNSSNNTVYADADGNIAYYHGNFIPKRDPKFDFEKPVDGSTSTTDWQGLHEEDECIKLLNPANGWIQNCNSTPFTSAAEYSPKAENYPNYMDRIGENFRGVHAIRLLKKAKQLDLDQLITLAYDPYLPAFEVLIPGLIKAYDAQPTKDSEMKKAIEILRQWDFAVSEDSEAMSLAFYYGNAYEEAGNAPEGLDFTQKINYYGTDSPLKERLKIFEMALSNLKADFGGVNVPWGKINRYQRITGDIQQEFDDSKPSVGVGLAASKWGALASFAAKKYKDSKCIYGTSGNSFVAVVEFGPKVKAKTLLAGGQSGNPYSPHFDDQVEPYLQVKFKDAAYYREDVEKRAVKKYKPGEKS